MNKHFIFREELYDISEALELCEQGLGAEFLRAAVQYGLNGIYETKNPVIIAALDKAEKHFSTVAQTQPTIGRPKKYDDSLLAEMVASGCSTTEMAAHFGCSVRTV